MPSTAQLALSATEKLVYIQLDSVADQNNLIFFKISMAPSIVDTGRDSLIAGKPYKVCAPV